MISLILLYLSINKSNSYKQKYVKNFDGAIYNSLVVGMKIFGVIYYNSLREVKSFDGVIYYNPSGEVVAYNYRKAYNYSYQAFYNRYIINTWTDLGVTDIHRSYFYNIVK